MKSKVDLKKLEKETGLKLKTKKAKISPELKKEIKEIKKEIKEQQKIKERTWRDMRILWFSVAPYIKCWDPETEILREQGWKSIRDIDLKDKLLTLNLESLEMEYQKPTQITSRNYSGKMIEVKSRFIDSLTTPEHKFPILRNGKRKIIKIQKYRSGMQFLKTGIWKGEEKETFVLPSMKYLKYVVEPRILKMDDWLEFLGYYLAEGNTHKQDYSVQLRQQNKKNYEKMLEAFKKITPFKIYQYTNKLLVRDKQLYLYLQKLGKSKTKFIPQEFKQLSKRQLKILINAMMKGDGNKRGNKYFTISEKLRDDFQEIVIKAGFASDYRVHVPKGHTSFIKGRKIISREDCYSISINRRNLNSRVSKEGIKKIPYKGKVYSLEVPNGIVLTRRKGKTMWSHNSGYGVVTKHFVSRLINRGFTAMVVAYYGLAKGGFLKVGDIVTFPVASRPGDNLGFKSVAQHHKKFGTDIVVFFTDFWVARPLTKLVPQCVAYTVLDHEDYAEEYQDVLRGFFKVAIASKHGCKEARKYGIEAKFIPHGVDLSMYHPLPKVTCKRLLGVTPKTFVLGIVAANNDKEPRKGWDKMFSAIRIFLDRNKEMRKGLNFRVFCHTDAQNNRGYDLKLLAKRTGIGKYIIFQDPYMSIIGLPDRLMNRIYNAFDVLMNLSRREGFCLPILEAQACGVPAIATDFSAMTERLNNGKVGWLVKPATTMLSPLGGVTAIPDEFKAAEALEEAVFNIKKRELYSKRSYAYAKTQTWDKAVDKYWMPFLEEIWNELKKPEKSKKPKVLFKGKTAIAKETKKVKL